MVGKPQLVFMHEGVFRPAQLVDRHVSHYVGWDVQKNCTLADEIIRPSELELIAAINMGQRTFEDEEPRSKFQARGEFDYYLLLMSSTVAKLIEESLELAQEWGAPYYSVVTRTTSGEPIKLKGMFMEAVAAAERYSVSKLYDKPEEPKQTEIRVHPTALLYVPRHKD